MSNYGKPIYAYMDNPSFQAKFALILYYLKLYVSEPKVLELGCGLNPIKAMVTCQEYLGIDYDKEVVDALNEKFSGGFVFGNFWKGVKVATPFNCIVWLGAESEPSLYNHILSHYPLPEGGILILDYMDIGVDRKIDGFEQVDGCKLYLPFVDTSNTWPQVNRRSIEVWRRSKKICK